MSTILEAIRQRQEMIESYEVQIGEVLEVKPVGQKAKILQQHQVNELVNAIVQASNEIKQLYEDKDNLFKDEIATMRGNKMFGSFYETLNHSREYHLKYPNLPIQHVPKLPDDILSKIKFSGEEIYGKYLDLHEFYSLYCNLPNIPASKDHTDYLQYLEKFYNFSYLPESSKGSKQYRQYLNSLWNYLQDFFSRVQPLVEMNDLIKEWRDQFESKWLEGKIAGWKHIEKSKRSGEPQPLKLDMFNSAKELEALGMDRLKEALEAIGLKCGGTLKDRAERLWSVNGKRIEDIPDKLKAKPTVGQKRKIDDLDGSNDSEDRRKQTAWEEYRVQSISEIMMDIIISTRRHVEKQQTLSLEEKELELYEEENMQPTEINNKKENEKDDDDDEPIYNPLNLPLGWDGKPIPYWLYKLHGLGVEFKCEICGNYSYWGRRNFDRHFQEWRHNYGMKCLGVPNSKHFHDITLIEDVVTLYNKMKDQIDAEQFIADLQEEFEDTEGNVLNRRTFEDLARQGLL